MQPNQPLDLTVGYAARRSTARRSAGIDLCWLNAIESAPMDGKLKHLDFIQSVINRLSTNSFLLKGWSVILAAALFALSAAGSNPVFVALALMPALVFWGLDGYFLALEKAYRAHYERVREKTPDEIDFCMNVRDLQTGAKGWMSSTFSKTLIPFHGVIVAAVVVVAMVFLSGSDNG